MPSRHREDNVPKPDLVLTKYETPWTPPGGPEQVFDTFTFKEVESRFIDDFVTPDYNRRIAKGEVINNPCHYEAYQLTTSGTGTYQANYPGNTHAYRTEGGSLTAYALSQHGEVFGFLDTDVSHTVARAKLRAIASLDLSPYAMTEDAFEIRETLRFLRNPFASLVALGKAFRKAVYKRRDSGLDITKAVADVWLTYRFAVSPLVRSAITIADSLNDKRTRPKRLKSRGFESMSDQDTETFNRSYYAGAYDTFHRTAKMTANVRSGILYEVTNPIEGFRFDYGFRLKDIPETVWAVLPYSFLVDRVLPISNSIRAITNLSDPNLRILAGWTVLKREDWATIRNTGQVVPPWSITCSGDTLTKHRFVYDRDTWSPSVEDAFPAPKPSGLFADAHSIADLIALGVRLFTSYK